jgi:chromosome segregation ATPase
MTNDQTLHPQLTETTTMKPNPTQAQAEALAREVSIYHRVTEPLLAELHKLQAELEEAQKGMSPAQREALKGLDDANLRREDFIAELQAAIPRLEAEAAEARATHATLLDQHEWLAAKIDSVRKQINAA